MRPLSLAGRRVCLWLHGRFDRTEVDMRMGTLLVEAKLTEGDFQTREAGIVEAYRDFDEVFARELLPRVELGPKRRKEPVEFPENFRRSLRATSTWRRAARGFRPGLRYKPGHCLPP